MHWAIPSWPDFKTNKTSVYYRVKSLNKDGGCTFTTVQTSSALLLRQINLIFLILLIHSCSNEHKPQIIYLKDEFWGAGGYLLDIHASLGASYHDGTIAGAVHQDCKVGLPGNVQGLSNHHLHMAQQEKKGLMEELDFMIT